MRSPLKALLVTGSLVAASLGAAVPAAVATAAPAVAHSKPSPSPSPIPSPSPSPSSSPSTAAPPTLDTSHFACSNGVCEVGPGNVGMSFAAGLFGVPTNPSVCTPYIMSVVSGSLPPGLQLGEPGCAWTITGTPKKAGTYAFTVQITPNTFNPGPSGTQQLTITIGTGSSDRPAEIRAGWSIHTSTLQIAGWDVNISALWSVSVTSTGRVIFSNLPSRTTYPIDGFLIVNYQTGDPCGYNSCNLTVTNSLGSSITVTLPPPVY